MCPRGCSCHVHRACNAAARNWRETNSDGSEFRSGPRPSAPSRSSTRRPTRSVASARCSSRVTCARGSSVFHIAGLTATDDSHLCSGSCPAVASQCWLHADRSDQSRRCRPTRRIDHSCDNRRASRQPVWIRSLAQCGEHVSARGFRHVVLLCRGYRSHGDDTPNGRHHTAPCRTPSRPGPAPDRIRTLVEAQISARTSLQRRCAHIVRASPCPVSHSISLGNLPSPFRRAVRCDQSASVIARAASAA